jgi:large repetitive protein
VLASSTALAAGALTGLSFFAASAAGADPPANTNIVGNCFAATGTGANFNGTQPISAAVAATASGGNVYICPGTWTDNVTVSTPMTIEGAGQGSTIVEPYYSSPTGYGDTPAASGTAFDSTVFLVQADNVTIQGLTIDGSSPTAVTTPSPWIPGSGCDTMYATYGEDGGCAGVTINAGAGIDTGNVSPGITGMSVQDVTVENIYSVGISDRSISGSFNFSHDTITNAGGEGQGIFTYESNGTISDDTFDWTATAIQSNWGAITVTGNTIDNSNEGVFLGNIGEPAGQAAGGSSTVSGNSVTNCWGQSFFAGAAQSNGFYDSELGIALFAPFAPTPETISDNTVTGCSTGLADFSSNNDQPPPGPPTPYATPVVTFADNVVNGQNAVDGIGALVSTDKLGYNNGPVDAQFTGNSITNFPTALYTDETNLNNWADCPTSPYCGQPNPDAALSGGLTVSASGNQFDGAWDNDATGSISVTGNWWGSSAGPSATVVAPDAETSSALIARAAPTWWTTLTGVPSAPQSPSAAAGNRQAAVLWSAPATTGSTDPSVTISSYTATASPGGRTCSSASTHCIITGLTNGTTYSFTVTAANAVGTGPSSSPASATPAVRPSAPTSPSAVPGNGSATISWSPPSTGGPITSYTALASPGDGTCTTSGTSCSVGGLTNGTPYTFIVTARNDVGAGAVSVSTKAVTPAKSGYHVYGVPPVIEAGKQLYVSATGAQANSPVVLHVLHGGTRGRTADRFGAAGAKFTIATPGPYTIFARNGKAIAHARVYVSKLTIPFFGSHTSQIPITVLSAIPNSSLVVTTSDDGTFQVPVPANGNVVIDLPPAPVGACAVSISDNGYLLRTQTITVS